MEQAVATVSQWTCEEVYEWAIARAGEKVASVLRHEEVDGLALLSQTEASLRAYGVAGGPATKVCIAVRALAGVHSCPEIMDNDYKAKTDTHEQLGYVWDSMGLSEEERQSYLIELSHRVQAVYQSHLQEQRDARDTCEERVRGLQLSIGQMCDQLQVDSPEPASCSGPLLQQIAFLSGQVDVLKQERERQRSRNSRGLSELARLYEELGEEMPDTEHLQLGAHRLCEIEALVAETHQKIESKKALLEEAKARVYTELQDLMFQEDEYTALDRLVLLDGSNIPLSALAELTERGMELAEINQDRKDRLKALARKIAAIWNILGIPAEHRKEFMSGNVGLGRATFEKCETELASLEAQKRAQLPQLLEACEAKLRRLWDETCYCKQEQDNFFESYLEMSNELRFNAIKQQIADAEQRLAHMQPLLELLEKREQIKRDEGAYTALQSDPNRFKIAGLPLRLEQMRKSFQSFPKLAARMRQDIEKWEAVNGPFVRNGERLLATMEANGEFEEGYVPGGADFRRSSASSKADTLTTPLKSARVCTTIPRSARVTPKQEGKYPSHSLPSALSPKKEVQQQQQQSVRKQLVVAALPPPPSLSARKSERENRAGGGAVAMAVVAVAERNNENAHCCKSTLTAAAADAAGASKLREKPLLQESLQISASKRCRTPLRESNHR